MSLKQQIFSVFKNDRTLILSVNEIINMGAINDQSEKHIKETLKYMVSNNQLKKVGDGLFRISRFYKDSLPQNNNNTNFQFDF